MRCPTCSVFVNDEYFNHVSCARADCPARCAPQARAATNAKTLSDSGQVSEVSGDGQKAVDVLEGK